MQDDFKQRLAATQHGREGFHATAITPITPYRRQDTGQQGLNQDFSDLAHLYAQTATLPQENASSQNNLMQPMMNNIAGQTSSYGGSHG